MPYIQIQFRRGTAGQWFTSNPILAVAEMGIETDTQLFKIGDGITVGNSCDFYMFCPNMPTYKLIPGGYMKANGVVQNNALIEFSDSFQLYEWVGTA